MKKKDTGEKGMGRIFSAGFGPLRTVMPERDRERERERERERQNITTNSTCV